MSSIAVTVSAFFAMLAVLILSHEFGHFIAAKRSGVKVEEFGFGYPPRLFSVKRGETEYSFNLLPLGGFVKLFGEEDSALPRSFASKRISIRFLILAAGPLMNLLLPVVFFSASFIVPHDVLMEQVQIQDVAANSPAEVGGMEIGDTILMVNGNEIENRGELGYYIMLGLGTDTDILLQKEDLSQTMVTVVPRWDPPEGQGAVGIMVAGVNSQIVQRSYSLWEGSKLGIQQCWETLMLFRNVIRSWIIGAASMQVAGPVGIAQIAGDAARAGISSLMALTALVSLNLAIINLLPFPALDGGRMVFLVVELLRRGKRISTKVEQRVNFIGFATLIFIMCVVTYFDIIRVIQG
jgi:regulator of sigma E protease